VSGIVVTTQPATPPGFFGPGFFGKVPARGDFVCSRLPRSFLEPWDDWLQEAVSASRDQLGPGWLEAYLTSPIWRFVLSPRLCGDSAVAGVLMPSADRIGRYFPFTLAAMLPDGIDPMRLSVTAADWFVAANSTALMALEEDFDFDRFDARVQALGSPSAADTGTLNAEAPPGQFERYSLWWTHDVGWTGQSPLLCRGLPDPGTFTALLGDHRI
jgi:type VI secretion system protein ImpM